jgi:hypothetical protein
MASDPDSGNRHKSALPFPSVFPAAELYGRRSRDMLLRRLEESQMADVGLNILVKDGNFGYFPAEGRTTQSVSHVHLKHGDTITWKFGGDFTIHFNQITPLHHVEYHGDADTPVSDTVRHNADPGVYKYTVLVEADGRLKLDDPDIIID